MAFNIKLPLPYLREQSVVSYAKATVGAPHLETEIAPDDKANTLYRVALYGNAQLLKNWKDERDWGFFF